LGHKPQFLIENGQIVWNNLRPLIALLAKCEHTWLLEEYKMREKWDKHFWPQKTEQEREDHFMSTPVIFRAEEKYICPSEVFWEKRYYSILFDKNIEIENVAINYLEGLEWVYKYYTSGCPDWKWKYNYHYPPLFTDLFQYIPYGEERELILPNNNKSFLPYTQLAYVLPPEQFTLLPNKNKEYLLDNFPQHYGKMQFQWAFCRYFWEAHSVGLHMDLDLLEKINGVFSQQ
jgi:5'-3' exonuclease